MTTWLRSIMYMDSLNARRELGFQKQQHQRLVWLPNGTPWGHSRHGFHEGLGEELADKGRGQVHAEHLTMRQGMEIEQELLVAP